MTNLVDKSGRASCGRNPQPECAVEGDVRCLQLGIFSITFLVLIAILALVSSGAPGAGERGQGERGQDEREQGSWGVGWTTVGKTTAGDQLHK